MFTTCTRALAQGGRLVIIGMMSQYTDGWAASKVGRLLRPAAFTALWRTQEHAMGRCFSPQPGTGVLLLAGACILHARLGSVLHACRALEIACNAARYLFWADWACDSRSGLACASCVHRAPSLVAAAHARWRPACRSCCCGAAPPSRASSCCSTPLCTGSTCGSWSATGRPAGCTLRWTRAASGGHAPLNPQHWPLPKASVDLTVMRSGLNRL